jgi:preprotein translocase SecE subunit
MTTFTNYIKATFAELRLVKWPTTQQTAFYTLLVIIISALVAAYAGAFDYAFSQFISFVVETY